MCFKNKIIAVILCSSFALVGLFSVFAPVASAQSAATGNAILNIAQLQQMVALLQSQIAQALQQIRKLPVPATVISFVISSITTSSAQATVATAASISAIFNVAITAKGGDVYIAKTGAFAVKAVKNDSADARTWINVDAKYTPPTGMVITRNSIKIPQGATATFTINSTYTLKNASGSYDLRIIGIDWKATENGKSSTYKPAVPAIWKSDSVSFGVVCTPKTCVQIGTLCGTASDGCGKTLNCGACSAGQTCLAGGVCAASCVAACAPAGAKQCSGNGIQTCVLANSCLQWSAAIACPSGQSCSGAGVCKTNCVAKTCLGLGFGCGSVSDGCTGTLQCGICTTGKTCTANKCATNCAPKTCASLGNYKCGSWPDACGKTIACGNCATGQTCSNGTCVAAATCGNGKCDSGENISNCSTDCAATGEDCAQNKFKMGFILLVRDPSQATSKRLGKINWIKNQFSDTLKTSTQSLATMDTADPVAIIQYNGQYNGQINPEILKKLYSQRKDVYDFIAIYLAFPRDANIGTEVAHSENIITNIKGIGLDNGLVDNSLMYYSHGKLKQISYMNEIDEYINEDEALIGHDKDIKPSLSVNLLLHETEHHWACYVGDPFNEGQGSPAPKLEITESKTAYGRDISSIHYYPGVQCPFKQGCVHGSEYWESNGDGTYKNTTDEIGGIGSGSGLGSMTHPFTLYFMGLLPKSEYSKKYTIYNAFVWGNPSESAYNFSTAKPYKQISVDDIIAVEGPRQCVKAPQNGPVCSPNVSDICKFCNSDGTAWIFNNDNTYCPSGQVCSNGTCVKPTLGTN